MFILGIFIVVALTGCATMPKFSEEINPLTLFDENAAMYAHVTIDGNEKVLHNLLLDTISGLDEDSVDMILSQSQSLYIAFFDKLHSDDSYIQIALQGTFPKFIVNSSLNESKGWKKHSAELHDTKYSYKEHTTGIQLATITSSLIVLSTQNVSILQERYRKKNYTNIQWPVAYNEEGFLTSIKDLFIDESSITLYFPNAKSLIPSILRAPIELAIEYAFGTIKLLEDKTLTMDIQLKMEDARIARGTVTILKLATLASDITVEIKDDTIIILSNIPFTSLIFGSMQKN